ncbi:hypothetical protein DV517_17540 [Streptomyces sp. S816]|uniref:hypothetical protein n=1 Tax=Streptomyces sp. S816 TaxID=2283197 RepID=UPI00109C7020|nr:hypothetical protein [Streptomyces sp. S816]TGZ16781.1 hypothetical protein DV517_17540 [Streptomyces sp. S816]
MTPWLRLTHPCLRLLLVLTAALPAYGTAAAYAAEAGPPHSPTARHPAGTPSSSSSASSSGHAGGQGGAGGAGGPSATGNTAGSGHSGHDHQDRPEHDGAGPQHPAVPSASASASDNAPSGEPSRAGSGAGEGKLHPGRQDGPWAQVEGDEDSVPDSAAAQPAEPETAETPTASRPTEEAGLDPTPGQSADQNAARQSENASEPTLRILPLGSGLVLIGLGLGLAFLGLRLRRT